MRFAAALVSAILVVSCTTPSFAVSKSERRIARGFVELGMARKTANCYGAEIGKKLRQQDVARAAKIVETARNSDEVRDGVTDAGLPMMDAFASANSVCDAQRR